MMELEKQIEQDFQFSKFVVCAAAGLNGWENKVYNDKKKNGAYIVTQPIKKLKKNLKEWSIDPSGWKLLGSDTLYDISVLEDITMIHGVAYQTSNLVFYKNRWEKTTKKTTQQSSKYTLEEHLIVTYSTKYQKYQSHIRDKKIERAKKLLNNPGKIGTDNPRNPKYYIQSMNTTTNGEVAKETYYSINYEKIVQESTYDGFYAVVTDLEDTDLSIIIQSNKQRWEIEESFEIMKSELKTRPIYVSKEESINGHLLTCFLSLLVYRILEKEYLQEKYTCNEIISTLRELNVTHINGCNYIPSFKRTIIVNEMAELFGFQPSREILTQKYLNKFTRVVNSKQSTKIK
uniref:IS1634 family transposase n=1 Tax=Tannockella kyphosi TaxID=2899121 RepID=UPI00201175C1|nr:transposase [Tannockella kyphosi]